MAMEEQAILYERLSPFQAVDAPSLPEESSVSYENYVVFRNLISVSSSQCASSESAAPDYFSLDVNNVEEHKEPSVTPVPLPRAPEEACTPASERTLEGNWFSVNSKFKSPMLRLHREILDFCDFLSPTSEEHALRNAAVETVFDVINYIWPNAKAEVFGSFETGLYLPSSDIDVVILGSNIISTQIGLQALSRALSQRGIAKKIQVIAKARVPIIKFVEKKSGISFDISFDSHNGPQAAGFIKEAVTKWPPLRPLCLILKIFLQQRELNEVYSGGIGSYSLLSMIIAMLRNQQNRQAPVEHNLGVLLLNFFDVYGCKLNTADVGISCNGRCTFFKKSSKGFSVESRSPLISIEDPQAPDNDVGKSSFNYYQVKSAFAMAFNLLTNAKTLLKLGPKKSILGTIIRPDAVLLERKGGSNLNMTFNNLFPDGEDPVERLFEDQKEIYCNWQLNDDEEELLPRGNGTADDGRDRKSSRKKRKSLKENSSNKKVKGSKENGSTAHSKTKQYHGRHHQNSNRNEYIP